MTIHYLSDVASDCPLDWGRVASKNNYRALFDGFRGDLSIAHVTNTKASGTAIQELPAASLYRDSNAADANGSSGVGSSSVTANTAFVAGDTVIVWVHYAIVFGGGGPDPSNVLLTDNAASCGGKRNNTYTRVDPSTYPEITDTNNWNAVTAYKCEGVVGTTSAPTMTATYVGPNIGFGYIGFVRAYPSYVKAFSVANAVTSGTAANNCLAASIAAPGIDNCLFVAAFLNESNTTLPTVGTTVAWVSRKTTNTNLATIIETYDQPTSAALVPSARIATTGIGYTGVVAQLAPKPLSYLSRVLAPGTAITGNETGTLWAFESAATVNAIIQGRLEVTDRYGINLLATLKANTSYTTTELATTPGAARALAATAITAYTPTQPWRYRHASVISNTGTMAAGTVTTSVNGPTSAAAGDSSVTPPTTQTQWLDPTKPYVAATTSYANDASNTSSSPVVPSGVASGQLLVAVVGFYWSETTVAPTLAAINTIPTGWTASGDFVTFIDTPDSVYWIYATYYKWATAADTGTYVWGATTVTGLNCAGAQAVVHRIAQPSAANGTNPFDSITWGTSGSTGVVVTGSVTPSGNNALVVTTNSTWMGNTSTGGLRPPDNTTLIYSTTETANSTRIGFGAAIIQQTAAEPTGSLTWTSPQLTANDGVAVTMVFLGAPTPAIAAHSPIMVGNGSSITTAHVQIPEGVVSGSLCIVCVTVTYATGSVTPVDTGWTLASGFASTGKFSSWADSAFSSKDAQFWFYKYASATENPDDFWDFTTPVLSGSNGLIISAKAFRIIGGPTSGNPSPDAFQFVGNVSANVPVSTFTPGGNNSLLLAAAVAIQPTSAATDQVWPAFPFFPIDRYDDAVQFASSQYGFAEQATAAATGTQTWDTVTTYSSMQVGILTIRAGGGAPAVYPQPPAMIHRAAIWAANSR